MRIETKKKLSLTAGLTVAATVLGIIITGWQWIHGLETEQKAAAEAQTQRYAQYASWRAITDDKLADLESDDQWFKDKLWELHSCTKP